MKLVIKSLALVGLVATAGAASAQTATGTLTNNLIIQAACTVAVDSGAASAAGATTFGNANKTIATIPQSGTALNTTAAGTNGALTNYSVTCGTGVTYTLAFDEGANAGTGSNATVPVRRLALTAGTPATTTYIAYNLYNGASNTTTPAGSTNVTGSSGSTVYAIYAKVTDTAASNTKRPGTYTDTVNVTLSYS